MPQAFKLEFYVPETHVETVKQALFAAGGGRWGNYAECCWQAAGTGQFRPLPGSDPFVGSAGALEQVTEIKVDMLVDAAALPAVIAALRASHPYETPAFYYWEVHL